MTVDLAQISDFKILVTADEYADLTAINLAGVSGVDLKDYQKVGRAAIVVVNEAFGANTTIAVEHSDDNVTFAAVPAATLTNVTTGAAATFANLSTTGVKVLGIDISKCRRYLRLQFATAFSAKAISALLVSRKSES